jgi:hypothetical protein
MERALGGPWGRHRHLLEDISVGRVPGYPFETYFAFEREVGKFFSVERESTEAETGSTRVRWRRKSRSKPGRPPRGGPMITAAAKAAGFATSAAREER